MMLGNLLLKPLLVTAHFCFLSSDHIVFILDLRNYDLQCVRLPKAEIEIPCLRKELHPPNTQDAENGEGYTSGLNFHMS